jgi:hypothetical protein
MAGSLLGKELGSRGFSVENVRDGFNGLSTASAAALRAASLSPCRSCFGVTSTGKPPVAIISLLDILPLC